MTKIDWRDGKTYFIMLFPLMLLWAIMGSVYRNYIENH